MAPTRILLATDFSEPSLRALKLARDLHGALNIGVHVVYVHHDPYDDEELEPRNSRWGSEKKFEAYMMGLQAMLKKTVDEGFGPDAQTVTSEVVRGPIAETVLASARKAGADLICVGTTGKNGVEQFLMGSVAQKLLRTSEIPVLTVH